MRSSPETPVRPPRHPGSNRGVWTIAAIFALGFAVLGGLFLSPKGRAPALPPGTPRGLPGRPVTGVLLDCKPMGASPDAIVAAVRGLDESPDLLLLVDVEAAFVPPVVAALKLQASYHPQLYQRARPTADGKEKIGVCVLSKHPLYAGRPVRAGERPIGVAADVVIGGRAFSVACVDVREPIPTGGGGSAAAHVAEMMGRVDVAFGRSAGRLFAGSTAVPDGRPSVVGDPAGELPLGRVDVRRRQDGPPGLTFRIEPRGQGD